MKTLHSLPSVALAMALGTALAPGVARAQTFQADTPLLASPDAAAKPAGQARAGAAAKILKRQGFWLEVEAGGAKGWVKLSAVKLATPGGPAAVDTGRLGSGNIVATSAARGLSAKDLLEGRSDEKAVDRLAEWRAESRQLQQFASEGGLSEVRLTAFLQAPRADTTSAAPREASEAGGSAAGSRARRNRKGSDDDM